MNRSTMGRERIKLGELHYTQTPRGEQDAAASAQPEANPASSMLTRTSSCALANAVRRAALMAGEMFRVSCELALKIGDNRCELTGTVQRE